MCACSPTHQILQRTPAVDYHYHSHVEFAIYSVAIFSETGNYRYLYNVEFINFIATIPGFSLDFQRHIKAVRYFLF
jgi:hypothetical protein